MLKTKMTELLGIKYPIQCGTMLWISYANLVAAVAEAGGFACLAAANFLTKKELVDEIRKTRDKTDQPFGVNVSFFPTLTPRTIESFIEAVIEEGVTILETAGRNPEPYRKLIVENGLIHIHKCARVKDAAKMSKMGLDAVAIVGTESGGHPGMGGVTSMVQIPLAVDAVSVPLIAGGGICDGRSLVAALALGADGVLMGTRFINTKECMVHPNVKQRFLEAAETETIFILESLKNPGRVLRNRWAEKVVAMEEDSCTLEQLAPLISGQIGRRGLLEGNVEDALFYCGQVVGRVYDNPSVADLINSVLDEASEVKERLNDILFGS